MTDDKKRSMDEVLKELRRKTESGEIRPSYDYSEFLQELKEDIEDGLLRISDTVQVLRAEKSIWKEYRPVIDWYYGDESTQDPLRYFDAIDALDPETLQEDLKGFEARAEQHRKDLPKLEEILVEDLIEEMLFWNKIT